MKKFNLSLVAVLAMSTFAVAGGNIAPVIEPIIETPVIVEEDNSAFYLGLGYGYFEEEIDIDPIFDEIFTMSTVMFQAGYEFNKYIAVEGRYWLGVTDLEEDSSGAEVSGDYASWGIYVKPQYPMGNFSVYALLGYASTDLEPDSNRMDYFDTSSFSWGLGAQYSFTENLSVFADYAVLGCTDEFTLNGVELNTDDVDVTIDTINFGLTYKF